MTLYEEKILSRKEIEEAVKILQTLPGNGSYNIPKLTWWMLQYEELYQYAYENKFIDSCFKDLPCPCSCSEKTPESRFSQLYPEIKNLVSLHQYEPYFEKELEVLTNIENDYSALVQWLKKNEKLASRDFYYFLVRMV